MKAHPLAHLHERRIPPSYILETECGGAHWANGYVGGAVDVDRGVGQGHHQKWMLLR